MKLYILYLMMMLTAGCQTLKYAADSGSNDIKKTIVLRRLDRKPKAASKLLCIDGNTKSYLRQKNALLDELGNKKISSSNLSSKRRFRLDSQARRDLNELQSLDYVRHDIPVEYNELVEKWIQYYQGSGRVTYLKWLIRAESLKSQIQKQLTENGVPKNLFYLAMIESGLNVSVKSHARAVGTWQFMNKTGNYFNLRNNHWVDERKDPIKSTVAAAKYLKRLYKRYDSWALAFAAYNAGPGTVSRAIRKTGSMDYWSLVKSKYLRAETKNYVPKFMAAYRMAMNPERYGFYVAPNAELDYPETYLALNKTVSVEELAKKLGVPSERIFKWNPELKRTSTPPSPVPYMLRVERNLFTKYQKIKGKLKQVKVSDIRKHIIQRGETLTSVARKYKISLEKLRSFNPNIRPKRLFAGKPLWVPY